MATIRQIEANRRKAQKSTGPRTVEGEAHRPLVPLCASKKARSAMNALKSGIDAQSEIITGEDPVDLETLAAEYHARFQSATPEQRYPVEVLIRSDWQLRRLARAEAQLWRFEIEDAPEMRKNQNLTLSSVLECAGENLGRLQRCIDSIQRNYQRALRELERLQAGRPAPQPHAQPIENSAPDDPHPPHARSEETKPIRRSSLPPSLPTERVFILYDPNGSGESSC